MAEMIGEMKKSTLSPCVCMAEIVLLSVRDMPLPSPDLRLETRRVFLFFFFFARVCMAQSLEEMRYKASTLLNFISRPVKYINIYTYIFDGGLSATH